jgi:hypothetical protein
MIFSENRYPLFGIMLYIRALHFRYCISGSTNGYFSGDNLLRCAGRPGQDDANAS